MVRVGYLLVLLITFSSLMSSCTALEKNDGGRSRNAVDQPFYFVQITDTHFGERDHFKRMRDIVNEINQLPMKVEFVVHTGDILADRIKVDAVVTETLAVLDELNPPVYYVAGNHDILVYDIEDTVNVYRKKFGKLIQRIKVQGVTFIFIYTEPLARSVTIPGYDPIAQLQALLRQSKDSPVIVCHHRPSVEDFYLNRMHRGWPEKERRRWITLLNEYKVKAVIAGHFHKDQHHWLGDVPLYVASSVASYYGREASFRVYEYNRGKIGYRSVYK